MSSYHIKEISEDYKTVNVVFHIPVLTGNNAVGLAWQVVLVRHLGGASNINSILPEVTGTAEETSMKTGAIIEKSTTVRFSSLNLTNTQRLNEVIAAYNTVKAQEISDKQIILNFYGKTGDIL